MVARARVARASWRCGASRQRGMEHELENAASAAAFVGTAAGGAFGGPEPAAAGRGVRRGLPGGAGDGADQIPEDDVEEREVAPFILDGGRGETDSVGGRALSEGGVAHGSSAFL